MATTLGATGALAFSWAAQIENRHHLVTQAEQAGAERITAGAEDFNGVLGGDFLGGDDHEDLVTRATGIANRLTMQNDEAERPGMTFAMPQTSASPEASPEPSSTATEAGASTASGRSPFAPRPKQADPRAVADRVYDLMRQELILARIRGGSR